MPSPPLSESGAATPPATPLALDEIEGALPPAETLLLAPALRARRAAPPSTPPALRAQPPSSSSSSEEPPPPPRGPPLSELRSGCARQCVHAIHALPAPIVAPAQMSS
jgi:hypothetical protein